MEVGGTEVLVMALGVGVGGVVMEVEAVGVVVAAQVGLSSPRFALRCAGLVRCWSRPVTRRVMMPY